jgi:hypothetical protein
MGMSDSVVMPLYSQKVSEYINENMEPGQKIAWLGQQYKDYTEMFDGIVSKVEVGDLTHHFYDVVNESKSPSFYWDVHDKWDLEGYDLVVGLRVLFLCSSVKKLTANINNICKNNDKVIFDFMSGNPSLIGGRTVFVKKNNSQTILPFFPDLYNGEFSVQSNHDDQVLTRDHLEKSGVDFENLLTFRDTVKQRFYTLAELSIES